MLFLFTVVGVLKVCEYRFDHCFPFGGLGSMVSQIVGSECPKKVVNIALPDAPVITGTSKEVFAHYEMTAEGIAKKALELV